MVGVSPALLGKKTSKLTWFSHSTDSQDGMQLHVVCVCDMCFHVYSVVIRHVFVLKFHSMIAWVEVILVNLNE